MAERASCRHAACLLAECLVDAGEFHEAGRAFDALRAIDPVRATTTLGARTRSV